MQPEGLLERGLEPGHLAQRLIADLGAVRVEPVELVDHPVELLVVFEQLDDHP